MELLFFLYTFAAPTTKRAKLIINSKNNMTMKKAFLCLAAVCCLVACNNQNTPEPTQEVTFHISAFEQSAAPMGIAPKQNATILDDVDGVALTDLYIFDGSTQLAHQTSDMDDFGTVTLTLTHGSHNLSFVCTRSTDISVADGTMTMGGVKPTFGKLLTLNVTNNTPAQDLTLQRLTGQMIITIQDAFPSTAKEIEFVINPRYSALDVTTLCGTNGEEFVQRVSCTSKVGKTDQQFTMNLLAPSLTDEYQADVTINVYGEGGTALYSVALEDVRLAANTKTLLSGKLFTAPSASVSVDHTWSSDIVGTF